LVRFNEAFSSALQGSKPYNMDYTIKRHDGKVCIIHDEGEVVFDEHGKTIRFFGTTQDITDHRRAEETLVESEMKYRQLVMQNPDGIFIIDLSGKFLSVNRAICDNLKYTEEEFLSMKIWDIVPEKYQSLHKQRLAAIMKGEGKVGNAEYEVKGKDGVVHSIEVLSAPYYDRDKIVGIQGIAHDITDRKKCS